MQHPLPKHLIGAPSRTCLLKGCRTLLPRAVPTFVWFWWTEANSIYDSKEEDRQMLHTTSKTGCGKTKVCLNCEWERIPCLRWYCRMEPSWPQVTGWAGDRPDIGLSY
jgi:hypothetical protein